ncbi:MAG: LysR family transcriptional regulator [Proteobacteria bacterium]|nr:LysR family transcriptional regulator [Pseudomonadota bacterium]
MDKKTLTLRLHLWLEDNKGIYFGIGRVQLLNAIEELGSLRKAADKMGMSYRAAWGKIKATQKATGVKLLKRRGEKREGYQLTPEGKEMRDKFLQWFDTVEIVALKEARNIFQIHISNYAAGKKPSLKKGASRDSSPKPS